MLAKLLRCVGETPVYGRNGLEYYNTTGDGTTNGSNKNSTPVANTWFHKLRMNHENNTGYYTELAFPLNNDNGIHYRVIAAGNEIIPWRQIADNTHSHPNYSQKGHEEYFGGIHIGTSAGLGPYIYTDSSYNLHFRYKLADGNYGYKNAREIPIMSLSGTTLTVTI